jgi:hypothetical protein
MKKFYLSIAFVLPIIGANYLSAGVTAAPPVPAVVTGTTAPSASTNGAPPPSGIANSSSALRKIFLVSPSEAQAAFDDATGFVGISPGKKVICFSQQNGQWLNGFLITPAMQPTLPASVCQTITMTGAPGPQVVDLSTINIPIATQPFNWKAGSASNPDEWYTPSGAAASTTSHGICISTQTGDIGIAIRNQGSAHQCTFLGRSVPLADPSILVLAK